MPKVHFIQFYRSLSETQIPGKRKPIWIWDSQIAISPVKFVDLKEHIKYHILCGFVREIQSTIGSHLEPTRLN